MDTDHERGLYGKYHVERIDGSSEPGGKHADCKYFVLDLTHDKHAIPALEAYALSCQDEYPLLAQDLMALARSNQRVQPDPLPAVDDGTIQTVRAADAQTDLEDEVVDWQDDNCGWDG